MFAILKARPEQGLSHADVDSPRAPGPGEVEVAVSMAGVCGTDFHIWKWDEWSSRRVKLNSRKRSLTASASRSSDACAVSG